MKWLRRLLIAAVVLLGVLAGAVALLPRLVDPDTLRTMLVLAARHHTGRELTVDGEIQFALWPRPALVLPRLALADAQGFGPEPFASIDGARVNLRLWPLLWGRLATASVDVDRPRLRLTVNARGRTNWDDLLAESPPRAAAARGRGRSMVASRVAGRVGIRELSLRGADVLWTDARSGRWLRVRDLDVAALGLDPTRPLPLSARGVLEVGDPPRSARLDLSGTAQRRDDGVWRAPDLRLGAVLAGVPEPLALRLEADARLNPGRGRLRLRTLVLEGDPGRVRGDLTAVRSGEHPWQIGSQLDIDRLDLRALAQRLGVTLDTADAEALTELAGRVELGADPGGINLARLDLRVDGAHWQGTARIAMPAAPEIRFALQADRLDLDRYLPARVSGDGAPARSPVDWLRRLAGLDLDGTLDLAALTGRGLAVQRGVLVLRTGNGQIALKPLRAHLYGGTAEANVDVVARAGDPTLRVSLSVRDVAAEAVLEATTGRAPLHGRLSAAGELTGVAAGGDALLRSLRGTLQATVHDGALRGIAIERQLCLAQTAGKPCDRSPDARFSALRASGAVNRGVWRSGDVRLDLLPAPSGRPERLTGTGTLDLPTGAIDSRLRAAGAGAGTPLSVRVRGVPGDYSVRAERPAGKAPPPALRRRQSP